MREFQSDLIARSSRILAGDSPELMSSASSSWSSLAVAPPPLKDMAPSPENNAHSPHFANATSNVSREGKTDSDEADDEDHVAVVSFGLEQKRRGSSLPET